MFKTYFQLYILLISFLLLNLLLVQIIFTDELYVQSYSGQLSSEMIAKMLSIKSKYAWINYLLVPVLLILKTGIIALCFWVGSFFNDSKSKYKNYLRVVLTAELVFVIFLFVRTGFLYYYNFQTLTEISQFQPFTLYSIINVDSIPEYLHYPLALISFPEAIYWIVLTLLLKPLISGNFWKRMGFIAKSYGLGLLVWVSIVVFLTLNFTT